MSRRSRSNWTTVPVNEVFPIFFTKTRRAAELLEHTECSINSLSARFTVQFAQMFMGHRSACGPHSGAQITWLNLAGEYRHQKRDQSPICLRKKVFGFRAQSIRDVRFADARPHACLRNESVTLQAGKVRSHGVIGQAQGVSEIIHGAFACSQKLKDFPSCAFEQPLAPAYMFHSIKDHGRKEKVKTMFD